MDVRTVEIEYLEDTFRPDGDVLRNKGDRVFVDKMSAHSLCDVKKVARRVADGPTLGTNKRAPRKRAAKKTAEASTDDDAESDRS